MVKWVACYHAFALAASACGVWSYTAAMAHFRVCLQIAVSAGLDGRRHQLAQVYDIVARQEWAEKAERGPPLCVFPSAVPRRPAFSFTGDEGFDVNVICLKEDPDLLARAKVLYDAQYKAPAVEKIPRGTFLLPFLVGALRLPSPPHLSATATGPVRGVYSANKEKQRRRRASGANQKQHSRDNKRYRNAQANWGRDTGSWSGYGSK